MAEDLQALIDRLQREAVDEGQRRARAIVEAAEAKAASLVREAEVDAAELVRRAERDAEAFTERSRVALNQAGRDVVINVRKAVEQLVAALVQESLARELRPELLAEMLLKMVDAYASLGGRERRMTALLGPDDADELIKLFAQRYRERLREGVELRLDNDVVRGFRLRLVDEAVEHDFTETAIAEALTHHLRPHLARYLSATASASEAPRPENAEAEA